MNKTIAPTLAIPPEGLCETLKRGHYKYLNMMKLDRYDPGINPDITIEDIKEECPDLFFTLLLIALNH